MLASVPIPRMVGLSVPETQAKDARDWALYADLGVKSMRVECVWSRLEATRGVYKWTEFDTLVNKATAAGIKLLAILSYAPEWAKGNEAVFLEGVQIVAAKIAERYPQIPAWEIFNEPNLNGYGWPFVETDAAACGARYGKAVNAFHDGFRAHNTEAALVAGALSPHGLDVAAFLDSFLRMSPGTNWDALSVHPYGRSTDMPKVAADLRAFLAAYGVTGKPIWMSEMGHNVDGQRLQVMKNCFATVGGLDAFFWFTARDLKSVGWNFGSAEYNWTKKPDYPTLRSYMRSLSR